MSGKQRPKLRNGEILNDADLRGAIFSGFISADFTGSSLGDVIFHGNVKTSIFCNADLSGTRFKAVIDGCDFTGANLKKADFEGAVEQVYTYKHGEKPKHQGKCS